MHIKKLPKGKKALFAKIKYLSDDLNKLANQKTIKDLDDINSEY